jgi:hypothetical protein
MSARKMGMMTETSKDLAREVLPSLYPLAADDPDRHVRFEAIKAIAKAAPEDPSVEPNLILLVKDPQTSPDDRRDAVAMLQQMGRGQEAAAALAGGSATRPTNGQSGRLSNSSNADEGAVAPAKSNVPGLFRPTDRVDDPPPAPDIDLQGTQSYTAAGVAKVRDWINRQPGTDAEHQDRLTEFQSWRGEQDQKILERVISK